MQHKNVIRALQAKVADASITPEERKSTERMLEKLLKRHPVPKRVKPTSMVRKQHNHTPSNDQLKQDEWIKVEVPIRVAISRKWAQLKSWYMIHQKGHYSISGNTLYAKSHTAAAWARGDIAEIEASFKPEDK